jgi:hypothetical protein
MATEMLAETDRPFGRVHIGNRGRLDQSHNGASSPSRVAMFENSATYGCASPTGMIPSCSLPWRFRCLHDAGPHPRHSHSQHLRDAGLSLLMISRACRTHLAVGVKHVHILRFTLGCGSSDDRPVRWPFRPQHEQNGYMNTTLVKKIDHRIDTQNTPRSTNIKMNLIIKSCSFDRLLAPRALPPQ